MKMLLLISGLLTASIAIFAQTAALYHFDADIGAPAGAIDDSGPNGLNGATSGSASYAQGVIGTSLDLTGDLDYVSIPNAPALNPTGSWTAELFLKPKSPYVTYGSDSSYVVTKLHTASQGIHLSSFAISFSVNGRIYGEIASALNAGLVLDSGPAVNFNDGQWHHVALVFDAQAAGATRTLSLYADYVLRASANVPFPSIIWGNFPLFLGAGNFPAGQATGAFRRNFDGKIDEFRMTNAALQPADFLRVQIGRFGLIAIAPASAATVELSWPTASTQTYQLQYHTELGIVDGWQNILGPFEGTGASLQTSAALLTAPPARFYRVIESP